MDQLVARLSARLGVDAATARQLIAITIRFLAREAPAGAVTPLFATHPWLTDLAAAPGEAPHAPADRHFGGMARLMEVADEMMGYGLTMTQVQDAVRETVDYARETVGAEPVDSLVRTIPGLRVVVGPRAA